MVTTVVGATLILGRRLLVKPPNANGVGLGDLFSPSTNPAAGPKLIRKLVRSFAQGLMNSCARATDSACFRNLPPLSLDIAHFPLVLCPHPLVPRRLSELNRVLRAVSLREKLAA